MHISTLLATVRVALVRSSWRSCFMRAALFIMRVTNSSLVFICYNSISIHPHRQNSDLYAPTSNSCISTPIEIWTHIYMNLFTGNNPYYHLLNYLLFLLKHPVYLFCLTVNIFNDAESVHSQLVTGTWSKLKPITEAVDGIFCALYRTSPFKLCTRGY